ncbi:MAG: FecR domain-containing protein [Chthoniobacterales bacterium]
MSANFKIIGVALFLGVIAYHASAATSKKEAHVTQIIRDVNLLPSKNEPHPAAVNDPVREGEAVRTGDNSRSELTFVDLTIERIGANSIFSFNKAGRDVQLSGGSVLMRVPKDSGGAGVHTSAVSVAVTGTTLILESARGGRSKLIVLEGGARLSLVRYPKQSQQAHGGQMIDVPAGATTVPPPVDIDLNQVMRTHPLVTDFPQLPSYPLIVATANQGPIYQGRPVAGGPGSVLPLPFPIGVGVGGGHPGRGEHEPTPPSTGGTRDGGGKGGKGRGTDTGAIHNPPTTTYPPTTTPTPPPVIGRTTGGTPTPSRGGRVDKRPTPPPVH